MLDAIALFREQDTRNELGLGAIRDGYACFLFPGSSTVQPCARYLLFVPWIYQELEKDANPATPIADQARGRRINLLFPLLHSDDRELS